MTNVPTRLREAILRHDFEGAFAIAARHLKGTDRDTVNRALDALREPEHSLRLGRNPAHDIKQGIEAVRRNFNPGADQ